MSPAAKFIKQMGGVENVEHLETATEEMLKANWPAIRGVVYRLTQWPKDWDRVLHFSDLSEMQKEFVIDRMRKLSARALVAIDEKRKAA